MPHLLSAMASRGRYGRVVPHVAGDVLELGCGVGRITELVPAGQITSYSGVDHDERVLAEAKQRHPEGRFAQVDLDDDPLIEGPFDVVLMVALIEHVYNQKHLFTQAREALRPGGRIVLTTPTPFGNDVVHRMAAEVGLLAKAAVEDHVVVYNKRRFQTLASDLNLELSRYRRFQLGCNQLVVLRRPDASS